MLYYNKHFKCDLIIYLTQQLLAQYAGRADARPSPKIKCNETTL